MILEINHIDSLRRPWYDRPTPVECPAFGRDNRLTLVDHLGVEKEEE